MTELGVRPEELVLGDPSAEGALRAEVYVVEPLGNETLVEVKVGDWVVAVRAERGWEAAIGAPVGLLVDPDTACFFDTGGATAVHRIDRPDARRQSGEGRQGGQTVQGARQVPSRTAGAALHQKDRARARGHPPREDRRAAHP